MKDTVKTRKDRDQKSATDRDREERSKQADVGEAEEQTKTPEDVEEGPNRQDPRPEGQPEWIRTNKTRK